jgi:hypothetical protein
MSKTKTHGFLVYSIIPKQDIHEYVNKGLTNTYLGYDIDDYGEHIILEFNQEVPEELKEKSNYVQTINVEDVNLMRFSTAPIKKDIVDPFINGKYSKIDREYVADNFSKYTEDFISESTAWKVLHKSKELKAFWEERLGVTLDDDAEVYSKAEPQQEVFLKT